MLHFHKPGLSPEQVRRHKEHLRRGLIHMAMFLFCADFIGTAYLVHYFHPEFFASCGKCGAIFATISCYLEV